MHIPASVTSIGDYAFSHNFDPYGQNADQHGFNLLPIYICSDTADCYAKTYADKNGIEFGVCIGYEQIPDTCETVSGEDTDCCTTTTYPTDVTAVFSEIEVCDEDIPVSETYETTETTESAAAQTDTDYDTNDIIFG